MEPGGMLFIHGVNKKKFDPVLDSANPFIAFSMQKYAKKRITKSNVTFDKFNYSADFQIGDGNFAEFRETFAFKENDRLTGKKRKQTHKLRMPDIADLVAEVEQIGFVYKEYIDLTAIGYEYQYIFCFTR